MSRRQNYYHAARRKYYPVDSNCLLYHAYWDGTAQDHSIYGNHGTNAGGVFVENGLSLAGDDDRVSVTVSDSLKIGTLDYTIASWFYQDTQVQSGWFSLEHSVNVVPAIYAGRISAGATTCAMYDPDWNGGATVNEGPISTEHWHCMVLSTDCNVGTIWSIDGATPIEPSGGTLSYDFQAYNRCYIGYRWGYWWDGIIGEVLFLKGLWTGAQMIDYFNYTKSRYGL